MWRPTTRRSLWAPGLVVVGVSVGVGAMLGFSTFGRLWPVWVLGLVAVIAGVAWIDRRLHPAEEPPAPEPERRRPRSGTSGKVYDLEQDRSTDKQRYLM